MDGEQSRQADLALRFFCVSAVVLTSAFSLAGLLIHGSRAHVVSGEVFFVPPAFWFSSCLLGIGSFALQLALHKVRIERQKAFRIWMLVAMAAGTFFVGVQSYGLWCLLTAHDPDTVQTGVTGFVFVFAALHGLHFVVAMLFVVFVLLRAFAGRYDHEYYWGVTVCAYFWHALGVVWICILVVLGIGGHGSR